MTLMTEITWSVDINFLIYFVYNFLVLVKFRFSTITMISSQQHNYYYWRRRRGIAAYLLLKRLQHKKGHRSVGTCEIFKLRKNQGAFHNLVQEMRIRDPNKFRNYHRMSVEDFDILVEKVSPVISKTNFYKEPISAAEMLSATIRYLAAGVSMKSISYSYRLGLSTVSNIIKETCSALWCCLQAEYLPEPSEENWKRIAEDFESKWNFPNCIGAIDGKHIRIQAPPHTGSDYFNYKDFFSIVLLAVCDADYSFTVVDIGSKGRQSDGGIFRNSNFGQKFFGNSISLPPPRKLCETSNEMVPYCLVADAAFPFGKNLMRPFPGHFLCQEKRIFNYRLSRARRVIENSFGLLVSKWRILERPIIAKLQTIEKMIQAIVVLHNFLRKRDREKGDNGRYCPNNYVDKENEDGSIVPGEWRNMNVEMQQAGRWGGNSYGHSATVIRNEFTKYFVEISPIEPQWTK